MRHADAVPRHLLGEKFGDRVRIFALSIPFFLIATPFELEQSGFVYLTKGVAIAGLITYATVFRSGGVGRVLLLPLLVSLAVLFVNTLVKWSDRAILGVSLIVLGTILGQLRSARWNADVERVIKYIIWINVTGLLFAFIVFYLFGSVVDLHRLIFPMASRAESLGAFARVSGFHTEPGTYAQWTLMLLFLYSVVREKFSYPVVFMVLLTCVMTVSLWALVGVTVMLMALAVEVLIDNSRSRSSKLFALVLFVMLTVGLFLQLQANDIVMAALRFLQLKGSFMTDSGTDKIMASRFFIDEMHSIVLVGRPIDPGFCPTCLAPQDAGLGMNAAYYFGIPIAVALFCAMVYNLWKYRSLAFVVPLLIVVFWKAHFYDPFLWMIVGYVLRMGIVKYRTRRHFGRGGRQAVRVVSDIRNVVAR